MQQGREFTITVNRQKLLTSLRENRNAHIKYYAQAYAQWHDRTVVALKKVLDDFAAHLSEETGLGYREDGRRPSNYETEYDVIIDMLEMSVDENITLTQREYRQWMRDEWDWSDNWHTTNSMYGVMSASR